MFNPAEMVDGCDHDVIVIDIIIIIIIIISISISTRIVCVWLPRLAPLLSEPSRSLDKSENRHEHAASL